MNRYTRFPLDKTAHNIVRQLGKFRPHIVVIIVVVFLCCCLSQCFAFYNHDILCLSAHFCIADRLRPCSPSLSLFIFFVLLPHFLFSHSTTCGTCAAATLVVLVAIVIVAHIVVVAVVVCSLQYAEIQEIIHAVCGKSDWIWGLSVN